MNATSWPPQAGLRARLWPESAERLCGGVFLGSMAHDLGSWVGPPTGTRAGARLCSLASDTPPPRKRSEPERFGAPAHAGF